MKVGVYYKGVKNQLDHIQQELGLPISSDSLVSFWIMFVFMCVGVFSVARLS